jgi:hypothetical protein
LKRETKIEPTKFGVIALLLTLTSFEEQFDFKTERVDNARIIVDGYIHQGNNPYVVNLSQLSASGAPTPISRAIVQIFNSDSTALQLKEVTSGKYQSIKGAAFGTPEGDYFLSVELPSAKYKSDWVTMPSNIVENRLDWREYQRTLTSDLGTDFKIPMVGISLTSTFESIPNQPLFLSWVGEEVYQFVPTDFPDPFGSIPPPCYIQQSYGTEEINIFSTVGFLVDEFRIDEIFWREIDDSFLRKHIFSVYGFSHTRDHYQYLTAIEALVENTGSLFDTPPGQALGNIKSITDGYDSPLGYFGRVIADTTRIAIYPTNLETFIMDDCLYDPRRPSFLD